MDVAEIQINLPELNPKLQNIVFCNPNLFDSLQKDLALLGDSLIGLFIRELHVRGKYPQFLVNFLVSNMVFASLVKKSNLIGLLPKGKHYEDHELGTVLEALVGAVYWQFGFEKAKEYFQKEIQPSFDQGNVILKKYADVFVEIMEKIKYPEIELVKRCQELKLPRPKFCHIKSHPFVKANYFSRVVIGKDFDIITAGRTKKEALHFACYNALCAIHFKLNGDLKIANAISKTPR
ncbi:hypothetical protein C4546_00270 [Candidatus Parcubacteria bacterium]|nr:MAG: hypothetical protein C4546_00270 [Candidatus Parcubacteria bacterium]